MVNLNLINGKKTSRGSKCKPTNIAEEATYYKVMEIVMEIVTEIVIEIVMAVSNV